MAVAVPSTGARDRLVPASLSGVGSVHGRRGIHEPSPGREVESLAMRLKSRFLAFGWPSRRATVIRLPSAADPPM